MQVETELAEFKQQVTKYRFRCHKPHIVPQIVPQIKI